MALMSDWTDFRTTEERERDKKLEQEKEQSRLNETIEINLSTDIGQGIMETRRYLITREHVNKLFEFSDISNRMIHLENNDFMNNARF